jgi:SAM-dependent methyltransferase
MTTPTTDGMPHAPATARNRGPILDVLAPLLPTSGTVLEIASGTGEHAVWFAAEIGHLTWQPSEPDPALRAAIAARVEMSGLANLGPPIEIHAEEPGWSIASGDIAAIICINMTQVAPWSAIEGLFAGAMRVLNSGGLLYLYGPFRRGGRHTAKSNEAFDTALRQRNPDWGVRDIDDLDALAKSAGFGTAEIVPMPADNFSLIYRKP